MEEIGCSLHCLSDTRWSARIVAVKPFAAHVPGLRKAVKRLEAMNLKDESKADVQGIQTYLKSFECVLMASIWCKALTTINYRSAVLQAREATIDTEAENIESLIEELKSLREKWEGLLQECKIVCKNIEIPDCFDENNRKKKRNVHFDGSKVEENQLSSSPETL